jgi:DNA-binding NtrC family response regulator
MVSAGKFREDLYYRIHVVVVPLPPLRERPEDVPQLVDHFLGRFAARYKRERGTVSRDALRVLMAYDWPGNVRQLEHVLLNAGSWPTVPSSTWATSRSPAAPRPSPPSRRSPPRSRSPPPRGRRPRGTGSVRRAGRIISQHHAVERDRILRALEACNWNRVKAAELSGIPRRTFYRRLREYGIQ